MLPIGDDRQTNGFSFIWTIHNFSFCIQKTGESLPSPLFAVDSERWCLAVFPRGRKNPNSFGLSLRRCSNVDDSAVVFGEFVKVSYVLSIRTVNGTFKKIVDREDVFPLHSSFSSFLNLQEIYKQGSEAYLDNDALSVRCRICKVGGNILESEQYYARTIMGVERSTYNWDLKTLLNLKTKKQDNLSKIPSFTMSISSSKGMLGEETFEVVIERTNANKLYFSTCVMSLLDAEKVHQSARNEHWFEKSNSEQIWTVSFANNFHSQQVLCKMLGQSHSKSNPIKCSTLRCELTVSSGEEYSKIENTVCGITMDRPLECSMSTVDSDILASWKENLRCLYSEGKLSDLTIRTSTKEFPVHKAMLCAQSAVFSAMFERDMKERLTGTVEIEDLEDDTVSRMLVFVYTGTVDNLDWGTASKLYFAADKYEMTALKEKCSAFLKDNIRTSNACECLIFSDMHNDRDLKSVAQDFVIENPTDIISSDEWKEFMKEKLQLAAETMHLLCMRNIKN